MGNMWTRPQGNRYRVNCLATRLPVERFGEKSFPSPVNSTLGRGYGGRRGHHTSEEERTLEPRSKRAALIKHEQEPRPTTRGADRISKLYACAAIRDNW